MGNVGHLLSLAPLVSSFQITVNMILMIKSVCEHHILCLTSCLGHSDWMEVDLLYHIGCWVRAQWTSHGVSPLDPRILSYKT